MSAAPLQELAPKKKLGCMKIALIILGAFVLLTIIGSFLPKQPAAENSPSQDATDAPEAGSEAIIAASDPLPIAVTAKELFGAYQANEASAQSYFGGQKLLVSGTVDKVALDFMDDPEVLLKTPNQFMSAHAALADDAKASAGDYSPGDSIRLVCDEVSEVASIPMLKGCRPATAGQKGRPIQWKK